jgi:hypothetical protein
VVTGSSFNSTAAFRAAKSTKAWRVQIEGEIYQDADLAPLGPTATST